MHRVPSALCVLLLLVAPPLLAQTPDSTATDTFRVELPEVTVEALRSTETEASAPFSVSIHQRSVDEIALQAPVFLRDTFRDLPGVWMNDRGHFALGERLVVRGMGWRSPFGVRGVQVLLDGIPLTLPDGQAFLDIADPLFIRQAELVRGPSSLFWGNGSGGVLFLNSLPTSDSPSAQVRAGMGSYGLRQVSGEVVLGRPNEGLGQWRVSASNMRQDGYRDNSEGRFTRGLLSGRLALSSQTQLQIVGAFVHQDAQHPGALTRSEKKTDPTQADSLFANFGADGAGKKSTQAQLGLSVTHDFESVSLDGTLYGGFRDLENPLPFVVIGFDRLYGGGRTSVQGTAGSIEWNVGADAGFQRDDRVNFKTDFGALEPTDEVELDQLETVVSGSVFGYGRLSLTDRLDLTLGVRGDLVDFQLEDRYLDDGVDDTGSRTFSAASPGVGLAYDTGAALFFANYSTAFETPTTTELVNRPNEAGGFNETLDPQRTRGAEIGVRGLWGNANLEYDVTLYGLHVSDRLVQFQFDDPDSDRAYFRNLGDNVLRGFEVALDWRPRPWIRGTLTYTGNRSIFADGDLKNNRVPGVPEQRLFGRLTSSVDPVWLRASVDQVSNYYVDNANSAVSEGYTLVDLRVGLQGLGLDAVTVRPYAEVSNLFDTQYNGSVSINAGDNFYEPGPGRAYKAGLTVTLP